MTHDMDIGDAGPLFAAAERRRDVGIARSAQAAEDRDPCWRDAALSALRRFALTTPRFRAEQFVAVAPAVPSGNAKAYGSLFRKAASEGWIAKDGFEQALGRHLSPTVSWKSLIYRGAA